MTKSASAATAQTTIYDSPAVCAHCQTARPSLCKHDADQAHGYEYKPRPRGCIVSFQLDPDEPLPF